MITEAGGRHHCPSPTLQTGVFKSLEIFISSFFNSPETGWRWKSSQIPLKCPKGSQWSVDWKNSGANLRWGRASTGAQESRVSASRLLFSKLLKARGYLFVCLFVCLFLVEGEGHYTPPSTGRKGTQFLITHSTPKPTHTHPN